MANRKRELYIGAIALGVVAISLVIYFTISNLENISLGLTAVIKSLSAFIYGAILAYLMLPCFNYFTKTLNGKIKKKTTCKVFSTIICLIILLAIVFGILGYVLPQLVISIYEVAQNTSIAQNAKDFVLWVENQAQDNPYVAHKIHQAYETGVNYVSTWVNTKFLSDVKVIVSGISTGVIGFAKVIMNLAIGIVVMIYIFMGKEHFVAQGKKMCYAIFNVPVANLIMDKTRFANKAFGGFISGKIIDSSIIAVLAFIIFTITKMPYGLLLSVIIGITNLIPFFGPFLGAIPTTILVLLIDPIKAIIFLASVVILQFIDGYVLGPKILGGSTGLSSFWVLFSILVFGNLFGFVGMLIGVPVFAVVYNIVSSSINYFLRCRGLSEVTSDYQKVEKIEPQSKEFIGEVK